MAQYFFNFDGFCVIEGKNREDARLKFWETANPPSSDCSEWEYYEFSVEPVDPIYEPGYLQKLQEKTRIQEEGILEKQLEVMLECMFPTDTKAFRLVSSLFGRTSETGYDPWDHLEAKVALIRYMGPYRTI